MNVALKNENNFNLIRFIAASLVIITHSYGVLGLSHLEPITQLIGFSMGTMAVYTFFVLSGFLISGSWVRKPNIMEFLYARFIRVFPALWLSVFLCAFLLGPAITSVPLSEYFSNINFFKFVAENSTLIIKGVFHQLPGVFSSNPSSDSVNISLWTLPYELKMYVMLLLLGGLGLLRYKYVILTIGLTLIAGGLFHLLNENIKESESFLLFGYFILGVSAYNFSKKIMLKSRYFFLLQAIIFLLLATYTRMGVILLIFTLPYSIMYLAFVPSGKIRHFNRLGDYSYGLYIYSFPLQQLYVSFGVTHLVLNIVCSFSSALVMAVVSWHFLEKPMLDTRRKMNFIREN